MSQCFASSYICRRGHYVMYRQSLLLYKYKSAKIIELYLSIFVVLQIFPPSSFIHYNFYESANGDIMCWQCNLEWFLCLCYFDKLVGSIFVIRSPFPFHISSRHLHTNQYARLFSLPFFSSPIYFICFFIQCTYIDIFLHKS